MRSCIILVRNLQHGRALISGTSLIMNSHCLIPEFRGTETSQRAGSSSFQDVQMNNVEIDQSVRNMSAVMKGDAWKHDKINPKDANWHLKPYYSRYCRIVVLYGCETWSLTLREECKLRVFENRILRWVFGPKRMRIGSGEGSTMRNFIVCTVHLI